jgi:hypothetical protein
MFEEVKMDQVKISRLRMLDQWRENLQCSENESGLEMLSLEGVKIYCEGL